MPFLILFFFLLYEKSTTSNKINLRKREGKERESDREGITDKQKTIHTTSWLHLKTEAVSVRISDADARVEVDAASQPSLQWYKKVTC